MCCCVFHCIDSSRSRWRQRPCGCPSGTTWDSPDVNASPPTPWQTNMAPLWQLTCPPWYLMCNNTYLESTLHRSSVEETARKGRGSSQTLVYGESCYTVNRSMFGNILEFVESAQCPLVILLVIEGISFREANFRVVDFLCNLDIMLDRTPPCIIAF